LELMAQFVGSLFDSKWDPAHPSSYRFCCGVMADRNTPARLRHDPELRREFPPKRLPTLVSELEAMALDHSEAYEAAKARRRAGLASSIFALLADRRAVTKLGPLVPRAHHVAAQVRRLEMPALDFGQEPERQPGTKTAHALQRLMCGVDESMALRWKQRNRKLVD
jgi:hypothetical protein